MNQKRKSLFTLLLLFVFGILPLTAQKAKLGLESGIGASSQHSDFTNSRHALWVGANLFLPLSEHTNLVVNASTMRNGFSMKYSSWNYEEKIRIDYIGLSSCLQAYFFKKKRLGIGFGMFVAQNIRAKEYWFIMEPKSLENISDYTGKYNKTKFGGLLELSYILYKKNAFSINSNIRYFRDLNNNKVGTPPQNINPTFNSLVLTVGVVHELFSNKTNSMSKD